MIDHVQIEEYAKRIIGDLATVAPDTVKAFLGLQKVIFQEGALDVKTKELIAFGISISENCDGCVAWHAKALRDVGATREEVAETIGVAVEMGGGVALYAGSKALDAYDQFAADAAG